MHLKLKWLKRQRLSNRVVLKDQQMNSQECSFCRIVAGDIPAASVYEDEQVLAFLDIGPIHKGHTLVIPKQHAATMDDCTAETLSAIGPVLGRIGKAVVASTNCDGYNCLCNNGRAAGQLVDHVHFHIIPRFENDGFFKPWPAGQYEDGGLEIMAQAIRKNIG
jgi:histidine triad (HIT) family protein